MKFMFSSNDVYKPKTYLYQYTDNYYRVVKCKAVREKGFEEIKRKSDKIKTEKEEIERISLSRTRRNIRELSLCNNFEYFVTLTLNKNICDRYDVDIAQETLRNVLHNYQRIAKRKGQVFKYLLICEKHKDGAFHFHGFMRGLSDDVYINDNNYISIKYFDQNLGFNSVSRIIDYIKCCNYICKYITKDCVRNKSRQIYICSRGLKKATKTELTNFNGKYFDYSNDFCSIKDFELDKMSKDFILEIYNNSIDK